MWELVTNRRKAAICWSGPLVRAQYRPYKKALLGAFCVRASNDASRSDVKKTHKRPFRGSHHVVALVRFQPARAKGLKCPGARDGLESPHARALACGRWDSVPVGARLMDAEQIRLDPDPYEPHRLSQGFRVGDLVIVSGQAAMDEQGQIVGLGNFDAQAEQTFQNLARVLEAGGSSLDRVVKVTIFLTDMSNFGKIVELRGKWFTPPYPADTIVEVSSLALPELEIEIEAIATAG